LLSAIDELEQTLATAWNLETLAVYGDQLQAIGDPRGELVAIDLAIDDDTASPGVEERRRACMQAWAGELAALRTTRFKYGFVLDTIGIDVARVLDSKLADHMLGVRIAADYERIAPQAAQLAQRPRRFVRQLAVRAGTEAPWSMQRLLDSALINNVIAATPNLVSFEAEGRAVLDSFPHPNLRTLRVTGFDVMAALRQPGVAMAATKLDMWFGRQPALLPAASLPALRDLDLSRNMPKPQNINVFETIVQLGVLPQLTRLAVPKLADEDDVMSLQEALDRAVALRELVVAGPRGALVDSLRHPHATISALGRSASR
jgi:hypothetical protein